MRIPSHPLDPATGLKECLKCGKDKPGDDFRHNRKAQDGRDVQCRECRRDYSKTIYDKRSAYCATWHDANLERVMFLNARTRAKKKELAFAIVVEDIYIPDRCPLPACGRILACTERERGKKGTPNLSSPSLDRWNPALGYVPDNIWVICMGCNARKQGMTGEDHVTFGWQLIEAFKKAGET